MYWLNQVPASPGSETHLTPEDLAKALSRGLSVHGLPRPGPQREASELLRRLYGDPADCEPPRPHIAEYHRLRAEPDSQEAPQQDAAGRIEFRYWPSLGLGYIEEVRVSDESRRRGLGARLLSFAVDHMRAKGSRRIFAFTTSPEGLSLCASMGFIPQSPEEAGRPWRRWVILEQ